MQLRTVNGELGERAVGYLQRNTLCQCGVHTKAYHLTPLLLNTRTKRCKRELTTHVRTRRAGSSSPHQQPQICLLPRVRSCSCLYPGAPRGTQHKAGVGEGAPGFFVQSPHHSASKLFSPRSYVKMRVSFFFFLSLAKDGTILNSALLTENSPECAHCPDTRAGVRRLQAPAPQATPVPVAAGRPAGPSGALTRTHSSRSIFSRSWQFCKSSREPVRHPLLPKWPSEPARLSRRPRNHSHVEVGTRGSRVSSSRLHLPGGSWVSACRF